MPAPLLVVDAPSVLYRAFFALPDTLTGAGGMVINALLGASNAILRVAADHAPRAVVICSGAEAARYRVARYPGYHADRPAVPDALAPQLARADELFGALGWTCADAGELEADDLLHSYALAEVAAGGSALLMTGDRDLFQCAAPDVTVLYLKTGVKGFEAVTPAEVEQRYGIPPALVPDFIALRGDPSDRLPGARGVGPKGAAALLRKYRTLDDAIAAGQLAGQAEQLRLYRRIAAMDAAAPLPDLPDQTPTWDKAAALARDWELGRLASRLEELAAAR